MCRSGIAKVPRVQGNADTGIDTTSQLPVFYRFFSLDEPPIAVHRVA